MLEIIPAILVDSKEEFLHRLRLVEKEVETVQVDVLDGSMFNATSWFNAEEVGKIDTKLKFELHLMIENPLPIIEEWNKHVPGFVRAIIHAEISRPLGAIINAVKVNLKKEVGIAINPATPLEAIDHHLHTLDEVLIMSVEPGASGREFAGSIVEEKLAQAKHHAPNIVRGIDGAVNLERIHSLLKHGAERFCVGSAIFSADDPVSALRDLQKTIST